ncbi:MAG: cation:proton antiporter, partial [Bdellovibrio sp.]|nr:cation:proton antiporter [Bdellovibrio sp.]
MKVFIFLIIGLAFGPSFLNISLPPETPTLFSICTYGFLFVGGLELSLKIARQNFRQAVRLSLGAFILPFIVGILTALFIFRGTEFKISNVLFLAIALSVSALPVAIQFLKDMNLYRSQLGNLIISAATLCDIVA